MKINEDFLDSIASKGTLNEKQFEILSIDLENKENWKDIALEADISKNDINLLMLLKEINTKKAQNQIVKNYHLVLEYNNIKAKVYAASENETKIQDAPISAQTSASGKISIYCDGACSGNPGNAGSGLAIYYEGNKPELLYGAFVKDGTNNIAELNALYQALFIASNTKSPEKIDIYSDSKYSIDCISVWAYSWKKNGWSKKGGEIKNLELIQKSHNLYEKIKNNITISHVKGHSGVEGNELADRMAVLAIVKKNPDFEVYSYSKIQDVLSLKSY